MEPKWPAFLPNQFELGNPKSTIGVVCGWTPKSVLRKRLEDSWPQVMSRVAGIGNLYTAERGVDMLVRNLLANPRINKLIFCGHDKSDAMSAAMEFFDVGCKMTKEMTRSGREYYTVGGDARVWADIPVDLVEAVRHSIAIECAFGEVSVAEIIGAIHGADLVEDTCFRSYEPQLFPPILEEPEIFPAPYSGQILRAKSIGEGWLELLHYILTYGKKIGTHYDQMSLEIMDLVMVITEQDANPKTVPKYLPFTHEKVEEYCANLLNPHKDEEVTYTYGNRVRQHFGVDQLTYVAQKLADDRGSRSVVINLWDAKRREPGSPCLNHLWFRIIDGRLFMTATIRSNDMYLGWPENAYGLRHLQDWVRCMILKFEGEFQDDSGLGMGDLVIVSQSAHIYSDCWEPAKEAVDQHRKHKEWHDEKGQWTFETPSDSHRLVKATLHSPEGEFLLALQNTPDRVRRKIARRGLISDVGHALYVGQMLEKFSRKD